MGLLWIKVVSYMKIINKQMATFIMSLIRILLSIRYFGVVLLIIMCVVLSGIIILYTFDKR